MRKLLIVLFSFVACLCCLLCFAGCDGCYKYWKERDEQGLLFAKMYTDYTHNEYNAYYVKTFISTGVTDIVIPPTYNDMPVVGIDKRAFQNSKITSISIPDSITYIGNEAFENCSSLTSLNIPSGVTAIGSSALDYCRSLESITVSEDNEFYASQGGILYDKNKTYIIQVPLAIKEKVSISDGVSEIGGYAFSGCISLESVVIPDSVTEIDPCAFAGCEGLKSVSIGKGVTSINTEAFRDCKALTAVTIPAAVEYFGSGVFSECESLDSITVDADNARYFSQNNCIIEKLNKKLWAGCKTSVIPDGVIAISKDAFCGCTGLTSITIPQSVTAIGKNAFTYCTGLTSITIPQSVTAIGENAFTYCSGLTEITVAEENKAYFSSGNCLIEKTSKKLLAGCKTSVIPDGVTSIEESAFCSIDISEVTIPDSVTSIGYNAFSSSGLTSVTIPGSVTYVGSFAFSNCEELKSVIILEGVTSISYGLFFRCSNLTEITIPSSVISIEGYAFSGCGSLKTINYNGKKKQWKAIEKSKDKRDGWYSWDYNTGNYIVYCTNGKIKK